MPTSDTVTLDEGATHHPNELRHFMRVVAAPTQQVATVAGQVVADSHDTVVIKGGRLDIYDPITYFPRVRITQGEGPQ